jgi:hypothetical protein
MLLRVVRSLSLAAVALGLLAAAPVSAAPAPKLDKALRQVDAGAPQRVIVRVTAGKRAQVREALKAAGLVIAEHPSIDAFTVELTPADYRKLAAREDIESVGLDAEVTSTATPKDSKAPGVMLLRTSILRESLGLTPLSARGRGVVVAVIDSGIAPLASFEGRIDAFYDFTAGAFRRTTPRDDYGHGTHVAGLIGAQQLANDFQYEGVAPEVHFVGVKVLDKAGKGRTSDVIRAIEFVSVIRFSRAPKTIRSSRRSSARCAPASSWWCPPATSARTPRPTRSATQASPPPAMRPRRSRSVQSTRSRRRRATTMK